MKEKIIKILDNYFDLSIYKGKDEILSCVASKIESLIKENYIEKEFIEWMDNKKKQPNSKYLNIFEVDDSIRQWLTFDNIYKYWLENIKNK